MKLDELTMSLLLGAVFLIVSCTFSYDSYLFRRTSFNWFSFQGFQLLPTTQGCIVFRPVLHDIRPPRLVYPFALSYRKEVKKNNQRDDDESTKRDGNLCTYLEICVSF